ALGGIWTPDCYSSGYTITLVGLDRVLQLAEKQMGRSGTTPSETDLALVQEATSILVACAEKFAEPLEMRRCVTAMYQRSDRNWAQSEWPGFYFEGTARAACMATVGGGPGPRVGSVQFDYQLGRVWDFKAHSVQMANGRINDQMILND